MPSCWQILACTYWKRKKAKHFFLAQLSCGGVSFQEWLSSLAWNCSFAALHLFLAFQGMQVIYFGLPRLILEVFVLFPSQRTMAPSRLPHAIRGRGVQQGCLRWPCYCFLRGAVLTLGTPAPRGSLVQEAEKPHMNPYFWGVKYLGIEHEFLFSLVWLRLEVTISGGRASFPTQSLAAKPSPFLYSVA